MEDVYDISPDGFTDIDEDKSYIIAINGKNNEQRNRFTICHEIGHIILHKVFRDEKKLEKEANMFAARILMPMLLIKELHITTPEELAELCNVSIDSATYRLKRFNLIIERNKFYTNPLEIKVYNQLKRFIQQKQIRLKGLRNLPLLSIAKEERRFKNDSKIPNVY